MSRKIVVGIPSYNEEETIGHVVRQVDLGLQRFYPHEKCLIINVDSNSTDNTKAVFLKTRTLSPKVHLNAGKGKRGKGKNLLTLFKRCNDLGIDYVILFDSDLRTIKPDWLFRLLNPLINGAFDYTAPVYSRSCYDGNVTNNFARPLTRAIFGIELQQPIGGEFGLNRRLYQYFLRQPVHQTDLGFGVDIFMTYHALGGGFRVCEVYLGRKKHKPGFRTLMDKFSEISRSAIRVSRFYQNKRSGTPYIRNYRSIPIFKPRKRPDRLLVSLQSRTWAQELKEYLQEYREYLGEELTSKVAQVIIRQEPALSSDLWIAVLAKFLTLCYDRTFNMKSIPTISRLIAPIFYWRAISSWREMERSRPAEIDKSIKQQGDLLRRKLRREAT